MRMVGTMDPIAGTARTPPPARASPLSSTTGDNAASKAGAGVPAERHKRTAERVAMFRAGERSASNLEGMQG
jgi:hypothetical protein